MQARSSKPVHMACGKVHLSHFASVHHCECQFEFLHPVLVLSTYMHFQTLALPPTQRPINICVPILSNLGASIENYELTGLLTDPLV